MVERWPLAVVFDLDGTLVDSAGDISDVLNAVLRERGYAPLPEAAVRSMVGGGARLLIERALLALHQPVSNDLVDGLQDAFEVEYRAIGAGRSNVYAGGRELIGDLAASGLKLGICTNKPLEITTSVLEGLGIADKFGAVVGETDQLPRKPDRAMLVAVLERLGVRANDAVMVGDSAVDVATARAAGVRIVLVSYGYSAIAAAELGGDAVIDGLAELTGVLDRIGPEPLPC